MAQEPIIHDVFEPKTATWQYIVADPATKTAIIIDSVLDFDPATSTVSTASADALLATVIEKGYHVSRVIETHVHADHLTASAYLQSRLASGVHRGAGADGGLRPELCIGGRVREVQERFAAKYGIPLEECEGSFDHLIGDDEEFPLGELVVKALHLPGHTPDHMGYQIGCKSTTQPSS